MGQCRLYTSAARDSKADNDSTPEQEKPSSGFASSFGFQSLTGLFQSPRQGRYSAPRTPEEKAAAAAPLSTSNEASNTSEPDVRFTTAPRPDSDLPAKPTPIDNDTPVRQSDAIFRNPVVRRQQPRTPQSRGDVGSDSDAPTSQRSMTRRSRLSITKHVSPVPKPIRKHFFETRPPPHPFVKNTSDPARAERSAARSKKGTEERVPNPFGSKLNATCRSVDTLETKDQPRAPWGLDEEKARRADSVLASVSPPTSTDAPDAAADSPAFSSSSSDAKLTHVTSTGEAHMIDVGSKIASKRVAIAFAVVRFNNPEPFRLIFENSNKKGDVLGVARVAGIMAAKRTSDLIPLCHPLAISKVELEVKLVTPGVAHSALIRGDTKFGVVSVQAQVECTGPTGVEMEALTAVSGAALTVYDMCKAVDRQMKIQNSRVVYKSGGKSGVHFDHDWVHYMGQEYFADRGLEPPPFKRWSNKGR